MSDPPNEALEALDEHMEEPPTWEELSTLVEIGLTPTSRKHEPGTGINVRRGPLAAVVVAGLVFLAAAMALLPRLSETPRAEVIVDGLISAAEGPAHIAVGFDSEGELCARAGSGTQGEIVCEGDGLAAVGFQAHTHLAVAGYVPASAAEVEVIAEDGRRRTVDLVPAPGRDTYAFGSITRFQPGSVELEVTDHRGVVTDRRSVMVGSIADGLGWETVPIPDEVEPEPMGAVWTGTELIFSDGYAYTPDARSWRELPSLANRGASFIPTTGVWTGTEAILCCGLTGSNAVRGFDTFHKTNRAPFHLDPPNKSVWTGDLMLVAAEGKGVAAYDPAGDTWELLAEPPHVGFGPFFEVAWTGSELIVWTTNEIGIALDPETRSWRTLPEPPDTLSTTFTHTDLAYTGSELIIWGSSRSQRGVGAMLDLQTNQWVELPEPLPDPKPCECLLRGGQTMVWTGESLLISTSHLSSDVHTSEPALIAYHPDSNRWTYEGVSPLGWDPGSFREWGERASMAGDRVVLRSDKNLYISPPAWQPQGPPISPDGLYAVERLFAQP